MRHFTLFLLIGLSTFYSCTPNEPGAHKIFKYNQASGITSLDPAFAKNQANIWAVSQFYNGLVQLDSNMMIRPCLAKSWSISEDGKTYTFHLRNDVYFHKSPLFKDSITIAINNANTFCKITMYTTYFIVNLSDWIKFSSSNNSI